MHYNRYYNLEDYLFNDVGPQFKKEGGRLSVEDFFCIVIWKANRAKTNIKKKLSKNMTLDDSVRDIAGGIFNAKTAEDRLNFLVKKWGFGLPMATAILTVFYPEVFTVYDYRVRQQLKLQNIYSVKKYFKEFLPAVKRYSESMGIALRETDKEMWGKSFYDDLLKLIK